MNSTRSDHIVSYFYMAVLLTAQSICLGAVAVGEGGRIKLLWAVLPLTLKGLILCIEMFLFDFIMISRCAQLACLNLLYAGGLLTIALSCNFSRTLLESIPMEWAVVFLFAVVQNVCGRFSLKQ